jgi:hypothetical protein
MKQRVFSHLKARAVLLTLVIMTAATVALQGPAPARHSRAGLVELLAANIDGRVDAEQLIWEPSRGAVLDLLSGRDLFFVGRTDVSALRDVYRARVRVSSSGQPLAVTRVHNVTKTPLADDTGLLGTGRHVAFASVSEGLVRSATLLDATGSSTQIPLEPPTASLTLALMPDQLQLMTAETAALRLDLATRTIRLQDDPKPVSKGGEDWRVAEGEQPQPGGRPAIFETTVRLGTLQVRLVSLEGTRLNWRLRAGEREPTVAGQRPAKYRLEESERARALLALNLGHATVGTDYGMAFQGNSSLPLRGDRATVIVPERGVLRVLRPGEAIELGPTDAAVQLPLLIAQGMITMQASSRGSRMARAGLCVLPNGRVLLALANNDSSDAVALALQMQDCSTAVELDRGSHHGAFLHRSGTSDAPLSAYPTSVLFALSND